MLLLLLVTPAAAIAQNNQVGDLNTSTQNSQVDSYNETNTTNYNGAGAASDVTPPPSAIAPSYLSNGQETCLVGSSVGTQLNLFGLSGGFYRQDPNCNRRRNAKLLSDLGMKIASVSLMCQDPDVFKAMFLANTPCPISVNGELIIGRRAYHMLKKDPALFIPDYNDNLLFYKTLLNMENGDGESSNSTGSISERFRSSLRTDGN